MIYKIQFQKYFNIIVLFLIILTGIILRLKTLTENYSFNPDECALGANLYNSYLFFFKSLENSQSSPPIFMIISKFLLNLLYNNSDSFAQRDLILRIFPCFCGCLSIIIFLGIINKLFNNNIFNYISLTLFSLNSNLIEFSAIFKQYSFELLVNLILIYLYVDFDLKNISYKKLVFISVFTAFSIWCSYTSFFILFPCLITVIICIAKNKTIINKRLFLLFLPILISIFFFIIYYLNIINSETYINLANYWKTNEVSFFEIGNFKELFYNRVSEMFTFINQKLFYSYLCLCILIMFCKKNHKAILFILLPIILVISFSFLCLYPFKYRMILFVIPLFIMIISQFSLLFERRCLTTFVTAIFLLVYNYTFYNNSLHSFHTLYIETRTQMEAIKKDNPTLENLIGNFGVINYYNGGNYKMPHYIILEEDLFDVLSQEKEGDYWIFMMLEEKNNQKENIFFWFKENNIEIIKFYDEFYNNSDFPAFIAHIRKL